MLAEPSKDSGAILQDDMVQGSQAVEEMENMGQKVVHYITVDSMVKALGGKKPARVFTFTQSVGVVSTSIVSFVDSEGVVHYYDTTINNSDDTERVNPIWEAIDNNNLTEVDGIIRVEPETGEVYQIFKTEDPNNRDKYDRQIGIWESAVKGLPQSRENFIQYMQIDDDRSIVDMTSGRTHLATILSGQHGHNIDFVKSVFPDVRLQDNGQVMKWRDTIKGKKT